MKVLLRNVRSGKRRAAIADLESIVRKQLEAAMDDKVKPALVKSHEKIVKDWKNQPEFAARKYIRPDKIEIAVYPTGEHKLIWIYVDQGTRPHPITPKRAKFLKFEWGGPGSYEPKTLAKPARTVRGGGRVVGGVTVYRKKVQHPGSEGRHFTETIAGDIKPDFKRTIENTFRRISRKVQE
jgi:hypothetical protein